MKRLIEIVTTIERLAAGLCISFLAIILIGDVLSREVFGHSWPWAQKLGLHLMIFAGGIGVSLASSKGSHLRPEVGDQILPKRLLPALTTLREFCVTAFCAFYLYISFVYVAQSKEFGDLNVVTGVPLWVVQAVFPFVFLMVTLKHLIYTVMPSTRPIKEGLH